MNRIQFIKKIMSSPEWETKNVKTISLNYIQGEETSLSQVRQGGIDNSHLKEVQDSIKTKGQEVPITVEDIGKDENGNTTYKLIDGGHRFLAIKKLRDSNKADKNRMSRWSVIRAHVTEFESDYERKQYQYDANEHTLPAKSSGPSDHATWLKELVYDGFVGAPANLNKLHRSSHRNKTDPTQYEQDLREALSFQFPDLGDRKRNSAVRSFLNGVPGKFKTWDSERAQEALKKHVNNSKTVCLPDKYKFVAIRETNHVFFAAAGNSLAATLSKEDRNREIVAIIWTNKTRGKENKDIDNARRETLHKINALNSHHMINRNKKLISRVFVAPQKLDDYVEEGFYEVTLNKNRFMEYDVPTTGFDTTSEEQQAQAAK